MMLDFILDMVNILTTERGRSLFSVLNIHQELLHLHTAPTSCAEVLIDAGFQTRYGPHVLYADKMIAYADFQEDLSGKIQTKIFKK